MNTNLFSLEGKVCIITGGRQGIGKTISEYIADAGADIAIFDIQDAEFVAKELKEKYGIEARSYSCDVTNPEMVAKCIEAVGQDFGTMDLLFNNAGIVYQKPVLELSPEEWTRVIDVNLNGVFYVAQAFARYLVAHNKPGNIVNTASMSGTIVNIPQPQASYNVAKAGVVHMTKSLAVEWIPHNIRVNSISPGYIETELTVTVKPEWRNTWVDQMPFKRMGKPNELAGAVIYLLSDASTYTSGCDLIVDGCFTNV